MNKNIFIAALVMASVFLFSCSSEEHKDASGHSEKVNEEILNELESEEEKPSEAQKVFYALPSPFELATLLKSTGVNFDATVLNKPSKVSNYNSNTLRSLNLGIYGADVSITSIYDKPQETMLYLSVIKKLADEIGITSAFDKSVMERLNEGLSNQDSLHNIVSEAFSLANVYLKENSRSNSASLILAGGWIEGVHIASALVDPNDPNEDLLSLISDQRFSLENLISLLATLKQDDEIDVIIVDLKDLQQTYAKLDEESPNSEEVVSTEKDGKVVFGGTEESIMDMELLKEVKAKVAVIRSKFVD